MQWPLNVASDHKSETRVHPLCAGKREKITITNNKDRLSQDEIDRLVQEAEEYAEEDKKAAGKVSARNSLETYLYNLKNQIGDKLGEKMDPSDKEKVLTASQAEQRCQCGSQF